jgi:phosphatidylglycerol lysyltransferase
VPALVERIKIARNFISIPILQFSKRTSMAIGIMLLILSKGIYDKVRSAYKSTIVLLILGAL